VLTDLHEAGLLHDDRILVEAREDFAELAEKYGVPAYAAVQALGQNVEPNERQAREWIEWLDRRAEGKAE